MINFVQLQEDVAQALLSCDLLASVNVAQYRKFRLQSEIDWSALWQTVRNGRSGCGVLVEMPTFDVVHPNLPGPEGSFKFSCAVVEEPNLNLEPSGGTLLSAEDVAQIVLETLHQLVIDGTGSFYAFGRAIQWTDDFGGGLVAYRVTLEMRCPRTPRAQVAIPTILEAAGLVTLTCTTAGADVFYTEDGSFPGPSNPGAVKYAAPFDVSGLEAPASVRWAGFKEGMNMSGVGRADRK